ncbi:MAG: peptidylprolyl isomerase [Candidatus Binatia bacterium]
MRTFLRDPLAHFLLGSLLVFGLFELRTSPSRFYNNTHDIVMDKAALLTFIQQRSKAFDVALAQTQLEALSPEEQQLLIDDYIREEVLYREALALGLDKDDYVIRRRLVQKAEFLAQGFAEATIDLGEETLQQFFATHQEDYVVAPFITFTHIFFDAEQRGWDAARREATVTVRQLNSHKATFADAPQYGDRFPYYINYVERTQEYVTTHFGTEMTRILFSLEPRDNHWYGPFASQYGVHLVMVTMRRAARIPALQEIRERVTQDAQQSILRERTEAAITDMKKRYNIQVVLDNPWQKTSAVAHQ